MDANKEYVVIFDFDGVLANSAPQFLELYKKICIKHDKPFPLKTTDDFRNWYDSRWENNYYRLGFKKEDIPRILELEKEFLDYNKIKLYEGIKEILLSLYENYNLAIASTTPSYKIKKKLEEENLVELFSIISGGDDGSSEKVKKIKKVLDYFEVSAKKCIMIGDTVMDITSAKELGVKCIGLTCGWNTRKRLEEAKPYLIFDNHQKMLPAIRYILSPQGRKE